MDKYCICYFHLGFCNVLTEELPGVVTKQRSARKEWPWHMFPNLVLA